MRRGTVSTVKSWGSMPASSSFQVSGVATGAPSRARVEYATTAVAPRPFRSQSRKILPVRSRLRMLVV